MEAVRIGFIGCGGNANGHMRQLSNLEDVCIAATCDVQEAPAQNTAKRYNAQLYINHKVMLERDGLD